MPFAVVRNDITRMAVDAIVDTAGPRPVVGAGVDQMIHEKAGPRLLEARQKIGDIAVGSAAVTPGFDLPSRFVIHTVGPVWRGGLFGERKLLRRCYDTALALALAQGCQSIAFPLISSGNYGFPKDQALKIAIDAFSAFLMEHEMSIWLVVFDRDSFRLSEKLFHSIASYIDQRYVDGCHRVAHGAVEVSRSRRRREAVPDESAVLREHRPCASVGAAPMPKAASLEEMLAQVDVGFTQKLLELIDKSGKKDSEIYKRANLSKQHFSKIRNDPGYRPTKPTAIALALALELDLEQTKDLIGRAGFALTNSSKFDLIVRYFIERGDFNIVQINIALYEFDQNLLGM